MIDSETIQEEREWKEQIYETTNEQLANDEVPSSRTPTAMGNLAAGAQGMGICDILGGETDSGQDWLATAAEYFVRKFDATIEHEDEIEGAYKAHRPKTCQDTLNTAILADEYTDEAIDRTLSIDEEWYLDTYPEFAHVFQYVRALAFLLADERDRARAEVDEHGQLEETNELYDAATACVGGILDGDADTVAESLDAILALHAQDVGHDPSAAVDFVSLDASALFAVALDAGLSISKGDLAEDTEFLLVTRDTE